MNGLAFVFINFKQAARFGHVGWGFQLDSHGQRFFFGSTDHLLRDPWWDLYGWVKYAHVHPQGHNDWWGVTGDHPAMLETMRRGNHIRYHAAKRIVVDRPNPDKALSQAESLRNAGWSVLRNNCVHQTHLVLSEYGARLPAPSDPLLNVIPKKWFADIDGEYIDLLQHR